MDNPSVSEFIFFFFGFGILPTFVLCKVGILFYLTYKEKRVFILFIINLLVSRSIQNGKTFSEFIYFH